MTVVSHPGSPDTDSDAPSVEGSARPCPGAPVSQSFVRSVSKAFASAGGLGVSRRPSAPAANFARPAMPIRVTSEP